MENHKQAQPYELLVDLFLSEESLDVTTTRDSSIINIKEVVRRSPGLKRFVGHADEFVKPVFVDKGKQGFVFRFEHNKQDLCLKLVGSLNIPKLRIIILAKYTYSSMTTKHPTLSKKEHWPSSARLHVKHVPLRVYAICTKMVTGQCSVMGGCI